MRPLIGITAASDESSFSLKRNYVSAVVHAGGTPLVLVPVSDDIPGIAEILDGLMVPGGGDFSPERYNETVMVPSSCLDFAEKDRTDFELALLQEMHKRRKPVLGICYGMQLINVMFGGSLYQDIGHQIRDALDHKDGRHGIKVTGSDTKFPGEFLGKLTDESSGFVSQSLMVNSSHHQAIKALGKGLEIFAVADDGIIEGVYHPDYPFLAGVQWHPERGCDTLSLKIFALFIEKANTRVG